MERRESITAVNRPEILRETYPVLVMDPYALNIIDQGPRVGEARLSFYSAFVAHTARELIEDGRLGQDGKVVLFGDASFGSKYPSTGKLMFDYLTRKRPEGRIIHPSRVVLFDDPDMNQTSTQVKKLAEYLKEEGLARKEVLYLGFEYHMERVKNHAKGFGVNARYAIAEFIHGLYEPKFDYKRMHDLLPNEEIEKMEAPRRKLSRYDKRGYIPRLLKPVLGGSYMIDNRRNPDGSLSFDYRPGKERLKELASSN